MKIGIFDSGIGGLSVLHRALKVFPDAEFIYYADVDNVPYGTKPTPVILDFCRKIMDYMAQRALILKINSYGQNKFLNDYLDLNLPLDELADQFKKLYYQEF